jgi:hypothetical protein
VSGSPRSQILRPGRCGFNGNFICRAANMWSMLKCQVQRIPTYKVPFLRERFLWILGVGIPSKPNPSSGALFGNRQRGVFKRPGASQHWTKNCSGLPRATLQVLRSGSHIGREGRVESETTGEEEGLSLESRPPVSRTRVRETGGCDSKEDPSFATGVPDSTLSSLPTWLLLRFDLTCCRSTS